jgi:hypothetical protein
MKYYKTVWINGKQIRTHRYVMESYLGRKLKSNEIVHHKDENIFNNDISNLEIVSRSQHLKMHPEVREKSILKNTLKVNDFEIIEMYKTQSIESIARHFEIAVMTVWNRLKKNNIKTNNRGHKFK